jgi:quinol monooxygenase YgiN
VTTLRFERYPVEAERRDDFIASVGALVDAMRAAAGNLWADVSSAVDDDPSCLVLSEWRTSADASAWAAGETAGSFLATVDPLLRGEPTIRSFSADA